MNETIGDKIWIESTFEGVNHAIVLKWKVKTYKLHSEAATRAVRI
jgi:hypothetical protein